MLVAEWNRLRPSAEGRPERSGRGSRRILPYGKDRLARELGDLDRDLRETVRRSPVWRERPFPGRAKKLARVACMRKLLTILNVALKHRTLWRPQVAASLSAPMLDMARPLLPSPSTSA
jgi:hypothetical protein